MQASAFTKDAPGKLVRNMAGKLTFIPSPLPGTFAWDNEMVAILSAAERALGRLIGIGQTLPNPRLVLRSFLRREAELSSRIENTFASFSDLALFDQTQSVEQRVPDVREVANNEAALTFGLESVQEHHREISLSLIKQMHHLLLTDVRGGEKEPGQFRTIQVHIGRSDSIDEATYVPPPPLQVPDLMEQLVAYIRTPSDLPPLVRSAMIHYQFEAIHPFADGNGRIGRVLILMLLCAEKVLPLPILNPSAFLERHRDQYYRHLLDISCKGRWSEWIKFFIRGMASEAMDAVERIDRLRSLQADFLRRLQKARASSMLLRLLDELFVQQTLTVKRAAELLGVGYTSALKNIGKLVDARIVWEITSRERNRIFFAGEIVEAVEGKQLPESLRRKP